MQRQLSDLEQALPSGALTRRDVRMLVCVEGGGEEIMAEHRCVRVNLPTGMVWQRRPKAAARTRCAVTRKEGARRLWL